jgi:hypothetical protein
LGHLTGQMTYLFLTIINDDRQKLLPFKSAALQCARCNTKGIKEMGDINQIQILGRIGADAEFRFVQSGKEVATFSVATDTGWHDKEKSEWHENTQWHHIVTFQSGLIGVLKDKAKKGVRIIVDGEMNYRSWRKDGESIPRMWQAPDDWSTSYVVNWVI